VNLSRTRRQESIRIFSSSDFNVEIDYHDGKKDKRLITGITRPDIDSNDYNLTVVIPNDVFDDFQATIKLIHPFTNFMLQLQVSFTYQPEVAQQQPLKASRPVTQDEPDYEGMPQRRKRAEPVDDDDGSQKGWMSYFLTVVFIAGAGYFMKNHFSNENERNDRNRDNRYRPYRGNRANENPIREPHQRNAFK
jgi:hypothetical protein